MGQMTRSHLVGSPVLLKAIRRNCSYSVFASCVKWKIALTWNSTICFFNVVVLLMLGKLKQSHFSRTFCDWQKSIMHRPHRLSTCTDVQRGRIFLNCPPPHTSIPSDLQMHQRLFAKTNQTPPPESSLPAGLSCPATLTRPNGRLWIHQGGAKACVNITERNRSRSSFFRHI